MLCAAILLEDMDGKWVQRGRIAMLHSRVLLPKESLDLSCPRVAKCNFVFHLLYMAGDPRAVHRLGRRFSSSSWDHQIRQR